MEYIDKLIRRVFIFTCLEIVISCCHSGGNEAGLRNSNLITIGDCVVAAAVTELVVAVAVTKLVVAVAVAELADLRERFFGFEPTIIVGSTIAKMYKKLVQKQIDYSENVVDITRFFKFHC